MSLPAYKVRILANACLTRYDSGERSMNDIIEYYGQTPEDNELVRAEILKRRPNMDFTSM